ncbi:hypothetical protein HK105_202316 [Polyrhizophydium stewartii]|uniref:Ankyrin repeat protein n=1 Tax=Polyrhizophydium stewartii TaxID=2732419 RepID=A0ABR4NEG3_9FUNG
MVLDHAGAFTKLINGLMLRIEAESLPQAERERMWQEAIMCNWQGDLRLLPWVHIRSTCLATPCTREMLGRLHACKAVDDAYVLQTAARERWPELLQSKYADELAAAAAREDAVWLLEDLICARKAVRPSAWLAGIAAQHGNLDAVRFLHSLTPAETWCKTVLDGAAASGNLDLVVWLATNRREGFSHAAMAAAAQNGHLHVVQWLHDNRDDGCSPFAMSWAAQGGHVHVLEWFTLHASPVTTGSALADEFDGHEFVRYRRSNIEACSPLTISAVARNGHVAVLEFLRARFPRCFVELPQDAFNEVADVLVLTWLHAHGLIVEPESLLERLVDRGDAACIRWLCTTFSLRITQSLFDKACGRNELRLARWMLEAGCVRLTEQRVAAAVASRNVGLLAVFFAHSNTLLALAYRQAVDCGVADVVEWMEFRYSRGVAQLALSFDV